MFGRKKNKDERREKKRHKPGMTQAEINKLEEVGIKRGFFSRKQSSKHKDEINKTDISRPLSAMLPQDDTFEGNELPSSVLQRATKYGSVVNRRNSSSSPPLSPYSSSSSPTKFPIPPLRRKSSNISNKSRYDVPNQNVQPMTAIDGGYSIPHSWKETTSDMDAAHQRMKRTPSKNYTNHRLVKLKKRKGGDFGVSLRRSAVIEVRDGKEFKRTIYFAEPGNSMEVDPSNPSRLFRGDQLIAIDGINVEMAVRDEIVSRIKNAGDVVTLMVQQIKELDEVSLPDTSQDYSLRKIEFGKPEPRPRRRNEYARVI